MRWVSVVSSQTPYERFLQEILLSFRKVPLSSLFKTRESGALQDLASVLLQVLLQVENDRFPRSEFKVLGESFLIKSALVCGIIIGEQWCY